MPEIERFYARQARLIDEGDAAGWAATFTPDGVFDSPSYAEPARGSGELEAFARGFHLAGLSGATRMRHVVTNLDVVGDDGADDEVTVHAYLQIVATPEGQDSRLVRLTTLTDRLVRSGGSWRLAHRVVRRDDAHRPASPNSPDSPATEGAPA